MREVHDDSSLAFRIEIAQDKVIFISGQGPSNPEGFCQDCRKGRLQEAPAVAFLSGMRCLRYRPCLQAIL